MITMGTPGEKTSLSMAVVLQCLGLLMIQGTLVLQATELKIMALRYVSLCWIILQVRFYCMLG